MAKHNLLKKLSIGIASLALICPLAMSGLNTNANARRRRPRTHRAYRNYRRARKVRVHSNRNYGLSYNQAKQAVRKAYNHKDKLHDVFSLHNFRRYGRTMVVRAPFGADSTIYFYVKRSGRYAHIHTAIYTRSIYASERGWVSSHYYHFYGVRRNATARI